jgi:transposase
MEQIPLSEMERTMKMQEVILKAMSKQISWWQAAEILGVSPRTMRRWKWGYERYGFQHLRDGRRGKPSRKKIGGTAIEHVLELYRERYFDFNVKHPQHAPRHGETVARPCLLR